MASGASQGGSGPSISDDGRLVSFQTTEVFVHDNVNGSTAMASSRDGRPANGSSGAAALSADGRYVAFHTTADNLGIVDGNGVFDVYVRAVSMPKITSITPSSVAPGSSTTLTVNGTGFLPGSRRGVSRPG